MVSVPLVEFCVGLAARAETFARLRSVSAWQGAPGLHQHARFLPRSSAKALACSVLQSAVRHSYSSTHCRASPSLPTTKGLPHFPGRQTFTVFGGIRQPFRRESVIRASEQGRGREPLTDNSSCFIKSILRGPLLLGGPMMIRWGRMDGGRK